MTESDLALEIDRTATRRRQLWSEGGDPGEVAALGRKLADLYESKRHLIARSTSGRSRDQIVRQARVESELERLSSR